MALRSVKDVRRELHQWGAYWARQSLGTGWPRKSALYRIRDICLLGISSPSDLHLFSDASDSLVVPSYLESLESAINELEAKSIQAIRVRYITLSISNTEFKNQAEYKHWLARAERELL